MGGEDHKGWRPLHAEEEAEGEGTQRTNEEHY